MRGFLKRSILNSLHRLGYNVKHRSLRNLGVGRMGESLENLPGERIGRVMDVGANVGAFARLARKVFPDADLLLVEPLPVHKEVLENWATEDGSASVASSALGPASGTALLTYPPGFMGESSTTTLERTENLHWQGPCREGDQIEVPVATLDELCLREEFQPDLIKIDAEGAEIGILQGGQRTLAKASYVLLESIIDPDPGVVVVPKFSETIAELERHGYQLFDMATVAIRENGRLLLIEAIYRRESVG